MVLGVFGSTVELNPKAQRCSGACAQLDATIARGFRPFLVRIPNNESVLLDNATINYNKTGWLFNFQKCFGN